MNQLPRLYGERVLLRRDKNEQKQLSSGLIVVQKEADKLCYGQVLAIGEIKEELNVGDQVLYLKYLATEIAVNNENFDLLKVEDLLAVQVKQSSQELRMWAKNHRRPPFSLAA